MAQNVAQNIAMRHKKPRPGKINVRFPYVIWLFFRLRHSLSRSGAKVGLRHFPALAPHPRRNRRGYHGVITPRPTPLPAITPRSCVPSIRRPIASQPLRLHAKHCEQCRRLLLPDRKLGRDRRARLQGKLRPRVATHRRTTPLRLPVAFREREADGAAARGSRKW